MHVLLTGAAGMLGRSFAERWAAVRPGEPLTSLRRADVDLRDAAATRAALASSRPDAVVHTAAVVAGIADKVERPMSFLRDNLELDTNLISAAVEVGVPELLYISSAAIYPQERPQPLVEEDLLQGPLEAANEGYALAKIAGGKLCAYASRQYGVTYRVAVPSNLYGPYDNFTPGRAHLVASTIAKVHEAKVNRLPAVSVWGDGSARREFTYAPDLAGWLVDQVGRLAVWPEIVNVGVGVDHSIREYYEMACRVVGYSGALEYDATRPAGVPRRLLESGRARALGWAPSTSLEEGYRASYAGFLASRQGEGL